MGSSNRRRKRPQSEGPLDTTAFLKVADKFIDLANRQNRLVKATELHVAFLYAAARYNAYVGKSILSVANHEDYVKQMSAQYVEMLRQHLADPALKEAAPA